MRKMRADAAAAWAGVFREVTVNILVAGGSGFVGRRLIELLVERGDQVTVVSRDPAGCQRLRRTGLQFRGWLPDVAAFDAVINLAGAPIFGPRWNASYREQIRSSRVETTRRIVEAINRSDEPPDVLVNGSAIGYYGDRGDEALTEASSPGNDFLAQVCVDWEAEATRCKARTVLLRTGVVLGRGGGALQQMLPPFKFGLGGPIGLGRRHFSWIHLDDLCGIVMHALDDASVKGPVNGTAPGAVTNAQFTKALGRVLKRPTLFPVPPFALRLKFGQAAEVLTASQRCEPAVAKSAGYVFQLPDVEPALRQILDR